MALQSAFRGRLEQMECTRNQRLSLLQSEKELQINKSRDLASKLSDIRSIEQRCLNLDCKIASQHLIISSLKSELHRLDSVYCEVLQQIRTLKLEVEELKELEKEKESYYNTQIRKMEDFKAEVESHVVNCQVQVQELRTQADEIKAFIPVARACRKQTLEARKQVNGKVVLICKKHIPNVGMNFDVKGYPVLLFIHQNLILL